MLLKILPGGKAGANVAGMIYIAIGLTIALVGADIFDLTKRRSPYRGAAKL